MIVATCQVVEVMAPFMPFGKNRPLDVPPP
jgi:hypothetical protein